MRRRPRSRWCGARSPPLTWPPRWTRTWTPGARPGCCTSWSCRSSSCWPRWSGPGSAADADHFAEMSATLHGRGEVGRAGRVRGGRARVQPPLAQAAPGGALHRARSAQDQEDQDRVHHRLGGADHAARLDRAPGPGAPAALPGRRQAHVDRRLADPDGRHGRAHPHDLQPDDRRDRPAVLHRPQPAEHPDPHRARPPHPAGFHRRGRLRDAAHRRLQPDRAAHHGRPVRRRGADRGVRVGARLPRGDRVPGVRRGRCRRHPRAAGQDQGDELRPRLRGSRPSGCPRSCASPSRRPAA